MHTKEFPEVNLRIAENQEQYNTLPVNYDRADNGRIVFCFELDEEEKKRVQETGEIWFCQLTFNRSMNPIAASTKKDDFL